MRFASITKSLSVRFPSLQRNVSPPQKNKMRTPMSYNCFISCRICSYGWTIAVILLTEQCLQCKLHLSVTIIVPRIGDFFLNRIVFTPKVAKCKKDDSFIIYLHNVNTEYQCVYAHYYTWFLSIFQYGTKYPIILKYNLLLFTRRPYQSKNFLLLLSVTKHYAHSAYRVFNTIQLQYLPSQLHKQIVQHLEILHSLPCKPVALLYHIQFPHHHLTGSL